MEEGGEGPAGTRMVGDQLRQGPPLTVKRGGRERGRKIKGSSGRKRGKTKIKTETGRAKQGETETEMEQEAEIPAGTGPK